MRHAEVVTPSRNYGGMRIAGFCRNCEANRLKHSKNFLSIHLLRQVMSRINAMPMLGFLIPDMPHMIYMSYIEGLRCEIRRLKLELNQMIDF